MVFIIENLEKKLYPWCILEYKHVSSFVGKNNLWITNVKNKLSFAKTHKESVTELDLKNVCVLDPEAQKELTSTEAKKFDYFVFGGILGDNPPQQRTKKELRIQGQRRHLGKEQMATDNAVYVVQQILQGKKLRDLRFADGVEIPIKEGESVILPYKYAVVNRRILISKELVQQLMRQKGF